MTIPDNTRKDRWIWKESDVKIIKNPNPPKDTKKPVPGAKK